MNENMEIWNQVCTTDPDDTKAIDFGEMSGALSVNPQVRIKKATEIFGPVGIGWGWEIIEERFDNGAPMLDADGSITGYEMVHTIYLELWHVMPGAKVKGSVKHYGHTPYIYRSSKGKIIVDKEYAKKTLTDAIGKCLSMLGFNSDVYEGDFQRVDYVQERMEEAEIAKAEDKVAKTIEIKKRYEAEVEKNLKLIKTAISTNEIEGIYRLAIVRAKRKKDKPTIDKLTKAAKAKKEELEK